MHTQKNDSWSRRQVLQTGLYGGLLAAVGQVPWRAFASGHKVLDREDWAFVAELSEGIWAIESTPRLGNDWRTGCNGGLVAGTERVLAIESFLRPEGALWVSDLAKRLTGRRPTDVLVTHFHGDHSGGLEGFAGEAAPRIWMTRTTLDLVRKSDAESEEPPSDERAAMLETVVLLEENRKTDLDLGDRKVTLEPRRGHTPSDVSVEIDEPSVVFGGDLLWNGFFPNYRDTLASEFTRAIRALRRERSTAYIPGHGRMATQAEVDALIDLVENVGEAASQAHADGAPLAEAAARYQLPDDLSEWILFNPKYFEVAFKAWYAELD